MGGWVVERSRACSLPRNRFAFCFLSSTCSKSSCCESLANGSWCLVSSSYTDFRHDMVWPAGRPANQPRTRLRPHSLPRPFPFLVLRSDPNRRLSPPPPLFPSPSPSPFPLFSPDNVRPTHFPLPSGRATLVAAVPRRCPHPLAADIVQAFPAGHQGGRGRRRHQPRVHGGLRGMGGKPHKVRREQSRHARCTGYFGGTNKYMHRIFPWITRKFCVRA